MRHQRKSQKKKEKKKKKGKWISAFILFDNDMLSKSFPRTIRIHLLVSTKPLINMKYANDETRLSKVIVCERGHSFLRTIMI